MTDNDVKREPAGDARPDAPGPDPRTGGGLQQERPEDRPMVGSVKPENYPKDRPK